MHAVVTMRFSKSWEPNWATPAISAHLVTRSTAQDVELAGRIPIREAALSRHARRGQARQEMGQAVILADGDAVFRPRKVERSRLWKAFGGNVLICVHKEKVLAAVEKMYPANYYVMIDDKLRILDATKKKWKDSVTTVFPKQGHYANDRKILTAYQSPDISLARIGDLLNLKRSAFLGE